MNNPSGQRRLWRRALLLVGAAALLQLVIGAVVALDPDEAYYWDWTRHLAPGYFDHPPAVALLMWAGTHLLGATSLGVRLFSLLAALGASVGVLHLARRHGGEPAALWAAVTLVAMPILGPWLLLATPDQPFYLAGVLVLIAVDHALGEPVGSRASLAWWAAAGLALGLGLDSKYSAALLPVGVALALASRGGLWRRLAEPGPYVAGLLALLVFAPVIAWNATHHWASFRFQLDHGLGRPVGPGWKRELNLLAGQLGVVTPILFVLLLLVLVRTLRRPENDRRYALAVQSLAMLGFFVVSAWRRRVEPNWPMMAYPPAIVLLASASKRSGAWLKAGCALGVALVLLIYLHTVVRILPLDPVDDPIRRGRGWDYVAERVVAARRGSRALVAANRYQDAALLAWHLPGRPFVPALSVGVRASQYSFWPGFADQARVGDTLVLLADEGDKSAQRLAPYFASVERGELVAPSATRPEVPRKEIWVLEGWRGAWPR